MNISPPWIIIDTKLTYEATRVQDEGEESRVWMMMSILRYLVPIDGLPDPKGPLSSEISLSIITEANQQIWEATSKKQQKRGSYQVNKRQHFSASCFKHLLINVVSMNTNPLLVLNVSHVNLKPSFHRFKNSLRQIFMGMLLHKNLMQWIFDTWNIFTTKISTYTVFSLTTDGMGILAMCCL